MPKLQKSLLLDEDVCRVISALEDETGASFTNIVTASILCFLFDESFQRPSAPDTWWMKHVLALKRGDIALEQMPRIVAERNIEDGRKLLGHHLDDADQEDPGARALRINESILRFAQERKKTEDVTSVMMSGDDPLEHLIRRLKGLRTQRGQFDEDVKTS